METRYALVKSGYINKIGIVEREDTIVKTQHKPFNPIPVDHFQYQQQLNCFNEWEEIEGTRTF